MKDDDPRDTRQEDDSLLREIAAAPAIAIPSDIATFVLLEPGTVVDGNFRIEGRLGSGGMGVVYAARDLKLDREVALKLMRLDRGIGQLGDKLPEVFEREARATARLNHPNVVTLHQFGNWNGLLYLVLERLRGETLNARIERGGVSLVEGVAILEQVARALVHTHAAGITHRDLKPQNVFLLADGGVKVLDFGVSGLGMLSELPANVRASRSRSTLSFAGTPGYMAPEQWTGGAQDARTDVWAVGVMLYQLVTGKLPFGTAPIEGRARELRLDEEFAAEARPLARIVERCVAFVPEERLASAAELAEQLRAARGELAGGEADAPARPATGATGGSSAAGGVGAIATARVRTRRTARRAAVIGAIALAGGAMAVATLRPHAKADPCRDVGVRAARSWDAATRARLGDRFGHSAAWAEVARALDTYAGQWSPLREAACRGNAAAPQTCLDAHLSTFTRFVHELDTAPPEQILAGAHALPSLSECSDPEYLARIAEPDGPRPRDPHALVPFALTVAGRGRDIVHGAAFVGADLVITGFASAETAIAGTPIKMPPGGEDRFGFVARIGSDGAVKWTAVLDKAGPLAITAIAGERGREHEAMVVVGGSYTHGAKIGVMAIPQSASDEDGFVAALDAQSGTVRWVRTLATTKPSTVRAIASDPDGNVYAAGDFAGVATFGGTVPHDAAVPSNTAPFVASWTRDGALRWVQAARGTSSSRTWSVAASEDAVVLGAWVTGDGMLGERKIGAAGCIVVRLARDTGAIAWLHEEVGKEGRCVLDAVAVRGHRIAVSGRRYHTNGGWVGELGFDDGALRWVEQLGTEEHDVPKALGFAPDGTLSVTGHYTTVSMAIGDTKLVSNGSWDAYVAQFDEHGRLVGSLGLGGATSDLARWLVYGPEGQLVIGGRFETTLRVGDRTLRGAANFDGFVLEISPALLHRQATPAGSAAK